MHDTPHLSRCTTAIRRAGGALSLHLAAALILGLWQGSVHAQAGFNACGDLSNSFGPYDYRKDRGEPLKLVEGAHFKPQVETLIRGQTSTIIGQDIDYVLRAFPNHHRALMSAMRLAEREKALQPGGMSYTIDCYFDRALRFRPDDLTVRMIFAGYQAKKQRLDEARQQLAYVITQAKDDPFTHYNVGLVYLEMKDLDAALTQAHRAMALGFPRTELRDKLQTAGKWVEPPAAAASAASEPAAGSEPNSPGNR